MNVKITILVDNYAGDGLAAEHGLSLWIETGNRRILLDTGQGAALAANAEKLGIDLSRTNALVLSHGHYDHTGGVSMVLRTASEVEVCCHPSAVIPRYGSDAGQPKPLGMQAESMRALDCLPSQRINWIQEKRELFCDVGLTGYIPRNSEYEDTGGAFFLDPKLSRPDPIDDDMALWIRTQEGVVVCVGCCHSGLINTLNQALFQSGASRLRAVIGGFHLLNADDNRIENTVQALRFLSPELIVPCHCTGGRALETLKNAFGARVTAGFSGTTFEF
ncbi:MAG: MBL fold metallo-hydrolase [Geobacter sp.]|nr:MAG: MBL fold metallo-hydrolase [Geobacter sp.]